MTFEYVRFSDRAIRQVCCFVNRLCLFSHIKGAKLRLKQTTLSDTTVDCQQRELVCLFSLRV